MVFVETDYCISIFNFVSVLPCRIGISLSSASTAVSALVWDMPKDTNFPCSYCEYSSKRKSNVSQHIKAVHEHRRDFKCSVCDYAASSRKDLSRHTKAVHEKIKDNACEHCDYTCSFKYHLTEHVKIVHKGIREYECNQCGQKFGKNHNLNVQ